VAFSANPTRSADIQTGTKPRSLGVFQRLEPLVSYIRARDVSKGFVKTATAGRGVWYTSAP